MLALRAFRPSGVTRFPRLLSTSTTPRRISPMPPRKKQKQRRGRKYREHALQSPLEEFFGGHYPQFEYNITKSASHEFYRLCDEFGWDRDDPERRDAYREFKNALVKQFNEIYGTDEENLAKWQNLCHIVDIDPVPDDLETCREVICGTYVNLVDLVDRDVTGQDVQVFESERELSQYTRMTGKFFPKKNAYAGGFLRYLLRHILDPA
ncbi:hypothetical protein EV363DRAFT_1401177 [Boletus edulis]|nr:hypothetical protein EV363DRAFT_1401177 [Boletus edulis]